MKTSLLPTLRMASLVGPLALSALAGCAPARVPFQVIFPSEESFLVTNTVRVRVFASTPTTTCANLVASSAGELGISTEALVTLSGVQPCDLRAGVSISDPGAGQRAFLVEGQDADGNAILVGCTQSQVYGGTSVTVNLSTTRRYQAAYEANRPMMTNPAQRCAMGGV